MFVKVIVRSLIILILISTAYFIYSRTATLKEKGISTHYANLVKNKLAYVSLTKLDPKKPGFDIEKSNLVGIIQETNKIGLEKPLNSKEKEILTRQKVILDKVFVTKSYEEGTGVLRSQESVTLLTDQTALIEELGSQIQKIKALPLLRLP
jgi:hypothetical protein